MTHKVGQHTYHFGRMDARTQFHVTRRIAPLLSTLGQAAGVLGQLSAMGPEAMLAIMGPLAERMASMPEQDLDYVINKALAVTSRQQGEHLVPVMADSGVILFADITGEQLMALTSRCLQENLGNFFDLALGLFQDSSPQAPEPSPSNPSA